ncbi:MAG: hypothetical protein ACSHX7_06610 [Luteolibacter sp.]
METELLESDFSFLDAELASLEWHVKDVSCQDTESVDIIARRALNEQKLKILGSFIFTGAGQAAGDLFAGLLGGRLSSDILDYRV